MCCQREAGQIVKSGSEQDKGLLLPAEQHCEPPSELVHNICLFAASVRKYPSNTLAFVLSLRKVRNCSNYSA